MKSLCGSGCLLEQFDVSVTITGTCWWQRAKLLKPGSSPRPLVLSTVLLWISCQPSSSSWVLTLRSLLPNSVWHVRCGIGSLGPARHNCDGQTGQRESSLAVFDELPAWVQKLSSGLMLLTLMTTHLFQFRFADAEQFWLITLTFFRMCEN